MRLKAYEIHLGITNIDFSKIVLKIRFFTKNPTFWLGLKMWTWRKFCNLKKIVISAEALPLMMALSLIQIKLIDEVKSQRDSCRHCKY